MPASASPAAGGTDAAFPWEVATDEAATRHDAWLLSFIDILALLLTLFVLLLAYQDSETEQGAEDSHPVRAQAMQFGIPFAATFDPVMELQVTVPNPLDAVKAFALPGEGLLPLETVAQAPEAVTTDTLAAPVESQLDTPASSEADEVIKAEETLESDEQLSLDDMSLEPEAKPVPAVREVAETPLENPDTVDEFLDAVSSSGLSNKVEVSARPGAVNLEISDSILFPPASAALKPDGLALLNELAALLREQPFILSVEGHTDSVPIETSRYPSNWELSSARAAIVTRSLIDQGIAPERLRAIGYGDTRPLADNLTPEGRSRNRRVSFVLQVPSQKPVVLAD
jgi:chemotaxis protein MotB